MARGLKSTMLRGFKPLEQQIAERQAEVAAKPAKDPGNHFEHRTAAYVFFGTLFIVIVTHVIALIWMMYKDVF
ncbi:hypothetical protein DPM19_10185 [Actinomadura craniellae]|uniref:Uncharacterized protein n=1 Tax=Actinomadura craniellae TaxID=2231787 RepID=A0A365H7V4_9ACTN|nr:hypothetical protein [Actinomadura craniellae]RAY15092.1 hypothetical protein DPM19_10185 [Actinomadura craniellae]